MKRSFGTPYIKASRPSHPTPPTQVLFFIPHIHIPEPFGIQIYDFCVLFDMEREFSTSTVSFKRPASTPEMREEIAFQYHPRMTRTPASPPPICPSICPPVSVPHHSNSATSRHTLDLHLLSYVLKPIIPAKRGVPPTPEHFYICL